MLLQDIDSARRTRSTLSLKQGQILADKQIPSTGTIMWKLPTTKGHPVYIPAVAYHMPDCDIRLFSPQSYFKLHGGDATITAHKVVMCLPDDHVIDIPIDTALNLSMVSSPQPTLKEQDKYGPRLLSSLSQTFWTYLVLPSPSTARPSQMP